MIHCKCFLQVVQYLAFLLLCLFSIVNSHAQRDSIDILDQLHGDGYREKQYPGLGRAASEIFYSDKRINFSGYAEMAFVENGLGERDESSGDLELYFAQLYRITPYVGIRITPKLFFTAELGTEYLLGESESKFNFFPEFYLDYIFRSWLSFRAGLQPLNAGYINNNEEPVLFYSVNRPESERIIVPTEWIEAGISFYGEIKPNLNYSISVTDGLYGKYNNSSTWIRDGAHSQDFQFSNPAIGIQINYLPVGNLTLSLSAYYNQSGKNESVTIEGANKDVLAPVSLFSGYGRWDLKDFGLILFSSYGKMEETYEMYFLTEKEQGTGQVLGKEVFAYYIEPSIDLLGIFRSSHPSSRPKEAEYFWEFSKSYDKLPIFLRYERLNTHANIDPRLENYSFNRNNLEIITLGINYKPNEYFAFKFDVRFRENINARPDIVSKETLYEVGIGLEF